MIACPVCRSGDIEHDHLLTVPEVAERRKAHPHTVRAAIRAGELAAKRIGRQYVVRDIHADAWTPRPVGRPKESER